MCKLKTCLIAKLPFTRPPFVELPIIGWVYHHFNNPRLKHTHTHTHTHTLTHTNIRWLSDFPVQALCRRASEMEAAETIVSPLYEQVYSTLLYYTILYYTIVYYATLCYTIRYFTILYYYYYYYYYSWGHETAGIRRRSGWRLVDALLRAGAKQNLSELLRALGDFPLHSL